MAFIRKKRKSKGAYVAVEQMILFAIGITVLIGIAGVYNSIREGTKNLSIEDQFREASELILSHVTHVYNTGTAYNANISSTFDVPEVLADQPYEIQLSNSTITITSSLDPNYNYTTNTLGLNHSLLSLSGSASSFTGRVKVNYNTANNSIIIETVKV